MRSVSVRLADLERCVIPIGFVDENLHTRVRFDCKKMFDEYPNALPSLAVSPPEGSTYPAIVTKDGDFVVWDVTASDCASNGSGEIQLTFVSGEIVAKSPVGRIRVTRSMNPSGEIPDPVQDWITQANAVLAEIPETIDGEFDAITAEASTLAPGSSATASFDSETKVLSIGVPEGLKGDDGYTPVKGVDYFDGLPGDPGADGFSPIATVSKSGKKSTITITDKNGTTTAEVNDGTDGDPTALIDDTTPAVNKTYSSNKLESELSDVKSEIASKVDEPSTEGTDGQVLATNGSGGRYWKTVSGGGGGTSDYSDLTNKPQINSVTLSGNKSLDALGIAPAGLIAPYYEDLTFPVYAGTNCIHNGTLYSAINDIQASEAWNHLHWATEMQLTENIKSLWQGLEETLSTNSAAPDYADLEFPVAEGTYCSYLGFIYIANQDIQTFGEFDYDAWDYVTVMDEVAKKYEKPSGGIPASDIASGVIPDISGKIDKPSSPATGAFLVYNGTTWVAQTLSTWQGGSY